MFYGDTGERGCRSSVVCLGWYGGCLNRSAMLSSQDVLCTHSLQRSRAHSNLAARQDTPSRARLSWVTIGAGASTGKRQCKRMNSHQ